VCINLRKEEESLGVVFNVANVRDVASELVQVDFVDEVSAHGVEAVAFFVHYILIIKEELIRFQQLLLLHVKLVIVEVILHNLVVFHVVVRNSLSAEHDQCVVLDHVQADEPDSTV
jgi:hypothetical protein